MDDRTDKTYNIMLPATFLSIFLCDWIRNGSDRKSTATVGVQHSGNEGLKRLRLRTPESPVLGSNDGGLRETASQQIIVTTPTTSHV